MDSTRLPVARLLLVGAVVPAIYSAADHWLLARLELNPSDTGHIVLTMAVFVVQIGLMGWLCGRLLDNRWWRWGLYTWSWLLIDLQLLAATVFAQSTSNWNSGRLLPSSLFAAQVGLAVIWAILGSTRWTLRLPLSALAALALSLPLLEGYGFARELFPVQVIALSAICLLLRWRRFHLALLQDAPTSTSPPSASPKQLQASQFSIRHVLIWTTSLAVILGALRALDLLSLRALRPFYEHGVMPLLTAGILVAAALVIAVWAALGVGSAWLRCGVLFLAMPIIGAVLTALNWYSESIRWGGTVAWPWESPWAWRSLVDDHSWLALWLYLAGSLLFAALIILRVLGYRLVRRLSNHAYTLSAP
jgi:hypothetical protein